MSLAVAIWLAIGLGIQTAISPCPLATNIAAVSFISKGLGSTRRVLLSGALYVLGRTLTYVVLGVLIMALLKDQLTGGSGVSRALQKYGPMAMGPVLILLGMILLDMLGIAKSLTLGGAGLPERPARRGLR